MIKEIKYNGHSASPSDYQSPDGDMAYALNVIPERGSLQPLHAPQVIASNLPGDILAVHRVGTEEHYIMYVDTSLIWKPAEKINDGTATDSDGDTLQVFTGVQSVTPIGNTLAVLDSEGTVHYFLWQNDTYKSLGSQLPELEATASLNTHIFNLEDMRTLFEEEGLDFIGDDGSKAALKLTGTHENYSGWLDPDKIDSFYTGYKTFRSFDDGHYKEAKENIYNRVFGVLNSCRKAMHDKGLFCEPFFVRFAYRLYDGTHCRHTVPLLMCPNSWGQPITTLEITEDGTTYFDPKIIASSIFVNIVKQNLEPWKDIITHVDVFVTSPRVDYTDSSAALVGIAQLPFVKREGDTWNFVDEGQPLLMSGFPVWETLVSAYNLPLKSREPFRFPAGKRIHLRSIFQNPTSAKEYYVFDVTGNDFKITDENGDVIAKGIDDDGNLRENVAIPITATEAKTIIISHPTSGHVRLLGNTNLASRTFSNHHYIKLKRTDDELYKEVLTEYNSFYRLAEISQESISKGNGYYGHLLIKENVLNNITTHPTLSDLGQQNNANIASSVFGYNNRLNLIVKGETLPICAGLKVQNPLVKEQGALSLERAYVKVVENAQTSYYRLPDEQSRALDLKIVYFAYPKATAVELEVFYTDDQGNPYVKTIPLTRHPFLNLAYAFNMFDEIEGVLSDGGLLERPQTPILYGNKIKTSPVNNPFIFREENTSELPVGKILALSTAAKALSQGQFGQFPLYAFTDEGIWALEVTGTGTYAGRQVIARDICNNPASVTQIDNAVLFTSERGIMLLSGSEVTCISEVLDGEVLDLDQIPHLPDDRKIPLTPWSEYRKNIQMLYCYPTQKIIVFNPDKEYFYVFSLESKQWAIQDGAIKSTVNNFPQAYAISGKTLVDYAVEGDALPGAFVTRPLKLDAPDVHKTITAIIQRGQFKTGNVNTLLYGSRDLQTWYPVWGSKDHYLRGMRGTPYKYFRIASTFHLERDESITGCSVDYEPRLNNKLR